MSQTPPLPESTGWAFADAPKASVIVFDKWDKPFCKVAPDGQVSIDWPETERVAALTDSTASTIAKALVFAREQARADLLAELERISNFDVVAEGETMDEWGEAWAFGRCQEIARAAIAAMKGQA